MTDLIPGGAFDLDQTLAPEEKETLATLLRLSIPENTLRAYAKDLRYLKEWHLAATGSALCFPASPAMVVKFILHHLYNCEERARNLGHGMPEAVEQILMEKGIKAKSGPSAPKTVRRRLASWATFHRARAMVSPTDAPEVKDILRRITNASDYAASSKSPRPIMIEQLDRLIDCCGKESLFDLRDRALLSFMFASGGRRRSEPGQIRLEAIENQPDQPLDPDDPASPMVPAMQIALRRTKTTRAGQAQKVWLIGAPVTEMRQWLNVAMIKDPASFVFPALRLYWKGEGLAKQQIVEVIDRGLAGDSVREILARRCRQAGLDSSLFTPHGLRSGYLTEAHNAEIPIQQAMRQSLHKSIQSASLYYQDAEGGRSAAARLLAKHKNKT